MIITLLYYFGTDPGSEGLKETFDEGKALPRPQKLLQERSILDYRESSAESALNIDVPKIVKKGDDDSSALDKKQDDKLVEKQEQTEVPRVKDLFDPTFHLNPSDLCRRKSELAARSSGSGEHDGGGSLLFLATVISAPGNRAARDAIRASWGRFAAAGTRAKGAKADAALAFLLGRSEDAAVEAAVAEEAAEHGDVIVSANEDTYSNLSLKTLSAFQWMTE